jgi:protein BCP1
MYNMLIEEIADAVEDKEPYEFTHYLILSKTYNEVVSALDAEENPRSKKSKAAKSAARETFFFHPEDEILQKHASASTGWDYTNDEGEGMADSKRAFSEMGIKTRGSAILIEASKFQGAVRAVGEYLSASQ